jgi:hypothetical protein
MEHFVIPDTQCRPGLTYEHLTGAGNYIVAKQPDKIIHLGDHWDMNSLSSYDAGTLKSHGKAYKDDIAAGVEGMHALLTPLYEYNEKQRRNGKKQYRPEMHFLIGNHEERIERYVNEHPEMQDFISYEDLEIELWGWKVHPFLDPVVLDGVHYAHYFYNPSTGRPLGGVAHTRLKNIGFSFTMGHQQGKDQAERYLSNGQVHRGLIVGSFYQHDEDYKGPQGNEHWRGCIYKHEVRDGNYDIMELSIKYLMENWT